jgi:hypothetical protein
MQRREFITLLGGAAATLPLAAQAQQPGKLPRIGVLVSASPPHPFADAFRRGLRSFGYTEGKNITIEFLYTDARGDRATETRCRACPVGGRYHRRPFYPSGESRHSSHTHDPNCHGAGWSSLATGPCRQLGPARRKRYRPIGHGC